MRGSAFGFVLLSLVRTCDAASFVNPPFSDKWIKEAEKKHSRVALLAVPCLIGISAITGGDDPVQFLNSQPASTQLIFYSAAGILESLNLKRFDKGFALRPEEEPGKLLPLEASKEWHDVEDWTGRLSMLIALGFLLNSAL